MKAWFKSKTVWVGIAVGILGVLQQAAETAPIPDQYSGLVLSIFGVLTVGLRAITTGPIGRRDG